jgi:glutaredoxin
MIVVYGVPGCGSCERAIALAERYALKYEYVNVLANDENRKEFDSKFPGELVVPQILWYGRHVGGYNELAKEIDDTRNYGDGQI